jgi:pimeloyl-ACP methyl ester carboxylesterase
MTLLERWAPAAGVRLAARAWFTIPPPVPLDRLPALPPGTAAPVPLRGRALHAVTWGAGEPVYLVHGWGGRCEQLGAFVAPLVAAGHRVVAFDGPGHGASPPGASGRRSTTIPELADALRAAVAEHGRPHAVVAHSMGAAVAAHAVRTGLRPAALVLLAPTADPRWVLDGVVRRIGAGPRIRSGLERAVARRVGLPWSAFDVASLHRSVRVPPTLVVHDTGDREVGPEHGRAIAAAWPGARLVLTEGLGHRRLLRDPAVVDEAVRFVTTARTGTRRPA